MTPKTLFVGSVIASMLLAPAARSFAQAPPPAPAPGAAPAPYAPPPGAPGAAPAPYPPPAPYPYPYAPQPYYAPAPPAPRIIKTWQEGQPVPYGYHPEQRARRGLVIAGAVVFGALYLYSTLLAADSDDNYSTESNNYELLWIPVLGPFMQVGKADSTLEKYVWVLDGVGQAGGVAMFVTGLLYQRTILVRDDMASMTVVPMKIGMDGSGLGVVGRF
jgi:hypothetical protein